MQFQLPVHLIGISIRTSNNNNQAAQDIGALWQRFYNDAIAEQIPNTISNNIIAVYTDYESDYTGAYTTIIGFPVEHLKIIPEGFVGRTFNNGSYKKIIAKGKLPEAVVEAWKAIWKQDNKIKRTYIADFEVYPKATQEGTFDEVYLYIGEQA